MRYRRKSLDRLSGADGLSFQSCFATVLMPAGPFPTGFRSAVVRRARRAAGRRGRRKALLLGRKILMRTAVGEFRHSAGAQKPGARKIDRDDNNQNVNPALHRLPFYNLLYLGVGGLHNESDLSCRLGILLARFFHGVQRRF